MVNFYTDNADIRYYLDHLDLKEMVTLKENDYKNAEECDYAPTDYDDAIDSYHRVLELVGELAGEKIDPRASEVDEIGARYEDGHVVHTPGIAQAVAELARADLMGFTMPRRYGGLNMPNVAYCGAIELVSRADASLMTIFGLQDIGETINSFADEVIKEEYLPRLARGEATGAMVLTEPDAGSDLQAVRLAASENPDRPGWWRLNGVKRFISNGCAEVLLVLARSEPGTTDARGLSLFVCDGGEGVHVRRIENKLGIKGSPTCEIQFTDTPARLIGQRRRGLTRHVMSLMNGARLCIAAQGVGIAEAAYRKALDFAVAREQFGKKIIEIPAVRDILGRMRVQIEAARALTYNTALTVDVANVLEERLGGMNRKDPEYKPTRQRLGLYRKLANLLTPMSKMYATERCNEIASKAIQVHGGSGYMKDYDVERHFRDARITNIYEGTTELQVVAAIGGMTSGVFETYVEMLGEHVREGVPTELLAEVSEGLELAQKSLAYLREQDQRYLDLRAREMVEIGMDLINSLLLLEQSKTSDHKRTVAELYVRQAMPRVRMRADYICSGERVVLDAFEGVTGDGYQRTDGAELS